MKKKRSGDLSFRLLLLAIVLLLVAAVGLVYLKNFSTSSDQASFNPLPFSGGRIAFVRNYNLYIAKPDGSVTQLTKDGARSDDDKNRYFNRYSHPVWSPDGKYLAYTGTFSNGDKKNMYISDGTEILNAFENVNYRSIPYWYSLELVWIEGEIKFIEDPFSAVKDMKAVNAISGRITSEGEVILTGLDHATECGGGGRPAWSNALSHNHGGAMDGIRRTFVYLPTTGNVFYSSGCEQQIVYLSSGSGKGEPVDLQQSGTGSRSVTTVEFTLSPDRSMLAGRLLRYKDFVIFSSDIALYSTEGRFIRQLTQNAEAYGPVFSPDGKMIYYADGLGKKPSLKAVDLDGINPRTIYTSDADGAISNIVVSPDGNELLFTRIDQIRPRSEEDGFDPGEVREALYIVGIEGTNPRLFLENASQGAWGE